VICRLLQGVFGAALVPLSQATMLDIYPFEKRAYAMSIWGMGVMVGPIMGPTVGGYLTDVYNWRWVFYINLPFGLAAMAGLWLFMPKSAADSAMRFDWTGFAVLALGIGALQMMLDRGELKDWFGSSEIWIEATIAALGAYLFIVHTATANERSFLNRELLKDKNCMTGTVMMFLFGIPLYGTMTLLPLMMQSLMNYPVVTTGLITAPRGIGTMVAMFLCGRLAGRIDIRLIILCGMIFSIAGLWQMSGFSLQMDERSIIVSGLLQGFGLGMVFTSLSAITFSTLPRQYLTQGTALFSLMRNVGGSIGISGVIALLTENTQIVHSRLVENLRPDNPLARGPFLGPVFSLTNPHGIAALNAEATRQAAMVAYLDDFKLMMLIVAVSTPLLLLLRRPPARPGGGAAPVPAD